MTFADAVASHFSSATLLIPAQMDGGERFDRLDLAHLRVEPIGVQANFVEMLRALWSANGRYLWRRIPRLVRGHDVVLLRVPNPYFLIVAVWCRLAQVPLCLAVTGDIRLANRYAMGRGFVGRLLGAVAGAAARGVECLAMALRSDQVLVYSEDARRTYRWVARNITLTQEATLKKTQIVDRDSEWASGRPVRILMVANYHKNKNLPMTIAACELLRQWGHDIELHLAGTAIDPDVQAAVREAASSPALAGRVFEHGFLTKPTLFELYRACDVMTLTSYSEGWPRVLAEGATFGLILVATAVGGVPAHMRDGHHGMLVRSGDAEALARALARVVLEPGLRAELRRGARELAEQSSVENIIPKWAAAIGRAAGVEP